MSTDVNACVKAAQCTHTRVESRGLEFGDPNTNCCSVSRHVHVVTSLYKMNTPRELSQKMHPQFKQFHTHSLIISVIYKSIDVSKPSNYKTLIK